MSKYSAMTDAEIAQVDLESLTQSEKAALAIVQDMAAGRHSGAEGLAKYIIDREEGRTPERVEVGEQMAPQIIMFNRPKEEKPKHIEATIE